MLTHICIGDTINIMQKPNNVNIRIEEEDYRRVKQMASRLGLNASEIVRRCLRIGCDTLKHVTLPGSRNSERHGRDTNGAD